VSVHVRQRPLFSFSIPEGAAFMSIVKIFVAQTAVRACVRLGGLLSALMLSATAAHAGFTISGTRVIYEEAQGETTVNVRHTVGDTAVLMQAWIDDGDPEMQPGQQNVPFILTPAVALMEPGNAQVIRVLRIGELPPDRESLFFFNVLEVPPDASDKMAAGESFVQFAMQARLKFFYRPRGLQPSINRAQEMLRFSTAAGADGKLRVRIKNPTPYHFTFSELALHASEADNAPVLAELDADVEVGPMVAPNSELDVVMKASGGGQFRAGASTQVRYITVNDQGGRNVKSVKLD